MILKNYNFINHLPEADYSGVIQACTPSSCGRYLWFKIAIDNSLEVLNVSVPIVSQVLNDFAKSYTDSEGNFDTDDFITSKVDFSLKDKIINGEAYSKIIYIKRMEDEANEA